jgi:hypothetical protein
MKRLMVLLGVLWLAGCASAPEGPPDWVNGTSAKYPGSRYLTGVGQADNAAVARDRARADLVKVFEARIAEESRDTSSASRESREGKSVQSNTTRVERNVTVVSERTVEGIDIAEVWREPQRDLYHALAVLDRMKAGESLRGEINGLDDLTARELENARGSDDLLEKIRASLRATDAQAERAGLQRQLRVVDPTGTGVPARWDVARLRSDAAQLAGRLRLNVQVADDPVGNLASVVTGAVSRAGFTNASAEEATYRLEASLSLHESQAEGWAWSKGALTVSVKDKAGNVRAQRQFPVKESARQAGVARQRVMGEVDRILRAELRGVVLGMESD